MIARISDAARQRLGDRLVFASISGGKDSAALALLLREEDVRHVRVVADTGFEAPETYAYLDLMRERLGPITVVRNEALWAEAQPGEEGMLTLVRHKRMFSSRLATVRARSWNCQSRPRQAGFMADKRRWEPRAQKDKPGTFTCTTETSNHGGQR